MSQEIEIEEGEVFDEIPAGEVVVPKSRYKPIEPPVQETTDADGNVSLDITGWVKGVKISDFTYDKETQKAVFTFEDSEGRTARRFFKSPHERTDIKAMEGDPTKVAVRAERIQWGYNEVLSMFKSFIYPNNVDETFNSLPKRNLRIISEKLWELYKEGKNNTNGEVWLKMVFNSKDGLKPKYQISSNRFWIGSAKYEPRWFDNTATPQYSDIRHFDVTPADADFEDPSTGFDEQAADAGDVFGTTPEIETLNTPDVDLL